MTPAPSQGQERSTDNPIIYKSPSEYFNKRYFNLMIFISVTSTLTLLTFALLYNADVIYLVFVAIIPLILSSMFILDYFKQYRWATFVGFALLPLWLTVATLFVGSGFSESTIMIAFLIFIYVLYSDDIPTRNRILIFTVTCHLGVLIYLNIYPPIIRPIDYPFDEVMVFLLAIGWILLFLKKIEQSKIDLISNLQSQNKRLVATTEELERFTHIASHDLKSPLRTIISFSEMIDRHMKKGDYESAKEDLNFIKAGAKQMNYLVSDILEFSKISDQKDIPRTTINLAKVLTVVISNLKYDIATKNAKIANGNLPSFYGNETEFILLFQNIIENGIKYNTKKKPIVSIWAEESDDDLSIFFKDNGIGIDQAYHDQIFKFFNRLHTSETYQGTGLGLGLCNKIIQHYDGVINVESKEGEGSTFSITLPRTEQTTITPKLERELIES